MCILSNRPYLTPHCHPRATDLTRWTTYTISEQLRGATYASIEDSRQRQTAAIVTFAVLAVFIDVFLMLPLIKTMAKTLVAARAAVLALPESVIVKTPEVRRHITRLIAQHEVGNTALVLSFHLSSSVRLPLTVLSSLSTRHDG